MKWVITTVGVLSVSVIAVGLALVFTNHQSTDVFDDAQILATVSDTSGAILSEGIPVHGDWVIEVRDPDGTLANRVEFSNEIKPFGQRTLYRLLSRQATVGDWTMHLGYRGPIYYVLAASPCATMYVCSIHEKAAKESADEVGVGLSDAVSYNLTVTNVDDAKLVFSGSIKATKDGEINKAQMDLVTCSANATNKHCIDSYYLAQRSATKDQVDPEWDKDTFSLAEVPAVEVKEGQEIIATVVYTFGGGSP